MTDDNKTLSIYATKGRDNGKTFIIEEIDPLTCSGYVLRLVAALRVDSFEDMLAEFSGEKGADGATKAPIDAVMRVLQGADPKAVHALIGELVSGYVMVAPDPQHPGALRRVMVSDIREMATLGQILVGFARLHFDFKG